MKVLVNGIGNIGTTLLSLLSEYKTQLGISQIYSLKNTVVSTWNATELELLQEKGILVCARKNNDKSKFESLDNIISTIDYIFDCNANTIGLKNKEWYSELKNLKGCSTQGSEKGFGIPFMTGVNNQKLPGEKYAQIVSCNTHSLASLILTLTGGDTSKMIEGDFVIVRRSEDLGNHQRLVSANVVSRHLDNEIGTHHAIDVKDLFDTKGVELDIQSSDITTPSQLMHCVRFNLKFDVVPSFESIVTGLKQNKLISTSAKFDSNIIFDLGRRYSPFGRLYSHTIVNENNLLIDHKNRRIKGWAFIPQEGNTILSTIHAFLLQVEMENEKGIMEMLTTQLIRPEW
jgi:glyceraldehyde-3-phosphate dehydrogenase type II